MTRLGASPPLSLEELLLRALGLEGRTLSELASGVGSDAPTGGVRQKGKIGELIERALGATGGSLARVDFPALGVELKTIPMIADGKPRESTFVCTVRLDDAELAEWESSWVRQKLSCVLWVPILGELESPQRSVGRAVLWRPTSQQEAVLRADFEDVMGLAGIGRAEDITAHLGRYLQVRPKARDGSARTNAFGRDGERIATVPRGFYLRPSFTGGLLLDPEALP